MLRQHVFHESDSSSLELARVVACNLALGSTRDWVTLGVDNCLIRQLYSKAVVDA